MMIELNIVTVISLIVAIPIGYLALFIADKIRSGSVGWKRRLVLVAISAVITAPLELLSLLFLPIIVVVDLLLVRWIYGEGWKPSAMRTLIWYLISISISFVFGIVLGIVLFTIDPALVMPAT